MSLMPATTCAIKGAWEPLPAFWQHAASTGISDAGKPMPVGE